MILVWLATGIVVFLTALYFFPIAIVEGNSMSPTLHDGQLLLCRRVLTKRSLYNIKRGEVYVYKPPYDDERLVIKRAALTVHTFTGTHIQFLGDNPSESYDSRHYGLVPSERIVAKVLMKVTR